MKDVAAVTTPCTAWLLCLAFSWPALTGEQPSPTLPGNATNPTRWTSHEVAARDPGDRVWGNSPHLIMDAADCPVAIYVERKPSVDVVWVATLRIGVFHRESIFEFRHSTNPLSRVDTYALAVDRRGKRHAYVYTRDYQNSGPVFSEFWVSDSGGRWRHREIRRDAAGGAAMVSPHLTLDGRNQLHVTAYVHNGFGTWHRVFHRHAVGDEFLIEPIPLVAGKRDSNAGSLAVGKDGRIHFVCNAMQPLNRSTDRHPDYPDTSLSYVTYEAGSWTTPEVIRPAVGPDPEDTKWHVPSMGITVGANHASPHVAYVATKGGQPYRVRYAIRENGRWHDRAIAPPVIQPTTPPDGKLAAIFGPQLDQRQRLHVIYGSRQGISYAWSDGEGSWTCVAGPCQGDLDGFAVDVGGSAYVLVAAPGKLVLHCRVTERQESDGVTIRPGVNTRATGRKVQR